MNAQQDFAGYRRLLLDTIIGLKEDKIDPHKSLAIAANAKVLNDSILAEVAVGKLHIQAHQAGITLPRFGKMELAPEDAPRLLTNEVAPLDAAGLISAMNRDTPAPAPVKPHLPNILVLGMRPTQTGRVAEKINGTADLVSWTTDDGQLVLRSLAKRADLIVVASGGLVNHKDTEALGSEGYTWAKAQNNPTSVLTAIKTFFTKS